MGMTTTTTMLGQEETSRYTFQEQTQISEHAERTMLVTGDGNGKSMFLFYLLPFLAKRRLAVVLDSAERSAKYLLSW